MASRKQRRRREKRQRYEWEYLEVDAEGNEKPVEAAKPKKVAATANGKTPAKQPAQGARSRRPPREVKPPSWNRAIKRGALFVTFLYIFLTALQHVDPLTAAGISLLYSAVFVPMFFFVDRMAYRAYQRRLGQG